MNDDQIEMYKSIRRAIKTGNKPEVIRLLELDRSLFMIDTPFGTWLHIAAAHGKLEIVQWLVAQGLDVNTRGATVEGRPLDEAASNGHLETVKYLIGNGASLDATESIRNPLISTIVGGLSEDHNAIAKILIDAGIDITIRYPNLDNMDVLELAKEWGRCSIVYLLQSKHARNTERHTGG